MAECWKCAKEGLCEWATPREIICSGFTQRKRTNYDRVIQKTPEELAKWLSSFCTCGEYEDTCPAIHCKGCGWADCSEPWLDWLRKEVEE